MEIYSGGRQIGPISQSMESHQYLEEKHVAGLFDSLLAALIVEQPEDPANYLDAKIDEVKKCGVSKVNWETFVQHLHPLQRPSRAAVILEDKPAPKELKPTQSGNPSPDVFKLTETN